MYSSMGSSRISRESAELCISGMAIAVDLLTFVVLTSCGWEGRVRVAAGFIYSASRGGMLQHPTQTCTLKK